MASTNEDAVSLATEHFPGRVLVLRHLPDRGTIELGWWREEAGAILPEAPVLELPAEAVEIEALAEVARAALAGPVASPPLTEGGRLVARAEGEGMTLLREPDPGSRVALERPALQALVERMLPEARRRLDKQWFGLPQQGR